MKKALFALLVFVAGCARNYEGTTVASQTPGIPYRIAVSAPVGSNAEILSSCYVTSNPLVSLRCALWKMPDGKTFFSSFDYYAHSIPQGAVLIAVYNDQT